jgi:5-methyltetrahydropteroyltriglutamate--homocysteine methyltransferase
MSKVRTTHVGSLPRGREVTDLLLALENDNQVDPQQFDTVVAEAIRLTVGRQVEIGLDLVSDGEMSKISYATYIKDRRQPP